MHMTVGFTSFIIFLTVQKLLGFWNNVLTGHLRCQLGEDTLSEWHVIFQDAIYTLSQQHISPEHAREPRDKSSTTASDRGNFCFLSLQL